VRAIRTTTISILVVGLLAGSAVGVAAQNDPMDASVFVWTIVDGSDDGVTIEASDTRASGDLVPTGDRFLYTGGQGYALALSDGTASLTNEGGTWTGTNEAINAEKFLDPQVDRGIWIVEMTGEDAYEGLSLTLFSIGVEGDENPEQWGYIYTTDDLAPGAPH
jgi:hypothetical protein